VKGKLMAEWNSITFGNAAGTPITAGDSPKSNVKTIVTALMLKKHGESKYSDVNRNEINNLLRLNREIREFAQYNEEVQMNDRFHL
jgi:hypothetical protein